MIHPLYDQLIRPGFLDGVEDKPLADLRAMRARCEQVESALSFGRRLLHGRLDLIESEQARRRAGEGPEGLTALVDRMPSILVEHGARPTTSQHRLVLAVPPECVDDGLVEVLDAIAGPATLSHLGELGATEVEGIAGQLRELERQLSQARRNLHELIDRLQGEITGRYQRGEATLDTLLG